MEIRVKDLLNLNALKRAEVIAGTAYLDNVVKGVSVIEAPDILNWLKGNEVLLTSFYAFKEEKSSYSEVIYRMRKANISALFIKVGRVPAEVLAEVVGAAEECGLPLISVTWDDTFIQIMYDVVALLLENNLEKLEYYKLIQDKFTQAVVEEKGLDFLINMLSELLSKPVILFDKSLKVISSSDQKYGDLKDPAIGNHKNVLNKNQIVRGTLLLPTGEKQEQVIVPVIQNNKAMSYLVIMEEGGALEESDYIIIKNSINIMALELIKRMRISEAEKKYKYDLFDTIISGEFDLEFLKEQARLVGWDINGSYAMVIVSLDNSDQHRNQLDKANRFTDMVERKAYQILEQYAKVFIRVKGHLAFVLWNRKQRELKQEINSIYEACDRLTAVLNTCYKDLNIKIGLGSFRQGIINVWQSYREAKNALEFCDILNCGRMSYQELGIWRLLNKVKDKIDLAEYIPEAILKLNEYDHLNHGELLKTLEMFICSGRNVTITAKKMFVHPKTVIYRLNRLKEIGQLDLDDHDCLFEVELGIKIAHMLQLCQNNKKIK